MPDDEPKAEEERQAAAEYREEAAKAETPKERRQYERAAKDEERHAEMLKEKEPEYKKGDEPAYESKLEYRKGVRTETKEPTREERDGRPKRGRRRYGPFKPRAAGKPKRIVRYKARKKPHKARMVPEGKKPWSARFRFHQRRRKQRAKQKTLPGWAPHEEDRRAKRM